jgi:hypothetical protein
VKVSRHGRGWDGGNGGNVCQGLGGLGGRRSRPASPVWERVLGRRGVGPRAEQGITSCDVLGPWQVLAVARRATVRLEVVPQSAPLVAMPSGQDTPVSAGAETKTTSSVASSLAQRTDGLCPVKAIIWNLRYLRLSLRRRQLSDGLTGERLV